MTRPWCISGAALAALLATVSAATAADNAATISEADCRYLVRHVPGDDVAYKPGVDVHGRKVAPADLEPERRLKVQNDVTVELNIPLEMFLKEKTPKYLGAADVNVGTVLVDRRTGQITYNGQVVSGGESDAVVAHCRRLLRHGK
jgi:hypothetical protein